MFNENSAHILIVPPEGIRCIRRGLPLRAARAGVSGGEPFPAIVGWRLVHCLLS